MKPQTIVMREYYLYFTINTGRRRGCRINMSSNVLQLKYEMVLSDVLFNNKSMIERGGERSQ